MSRRLPETDSRPAAAARSGPTLDDGWAQVAATWRADAVMAEQTGARLEEIGARFLVRLRRSGLTRWAQVGSADCRGFVTAATRSSGTPSVATQHLRRSTIRAVFRTLRGLGLVDGDPTLDLVLPPRQSREYRPLTDDEVILCRATSRLGHAGATSLRRATAWALGEATAASSEIGAVRVGDLDSPDRPRWFALPDSRRYAARVARLSDWGALVVARQVDVLLAAGGNGATLLAYGGAGDPGQYLAQASVCTHLTKVLNLAGLGDDPGVRARSLRGWAGATLYRDGMPIEQVAVRLGCHSLDAAAAEIGLRWKPPAP
jgi:integrase/recombinase XerC